VSDTTCPGEFSRVEKADERAGRVLPDAQSSKRNGQGNRSVGADSFQLAQRQSLSGFRKLLQDSRLFVETEAMTAKSLQKAFRIALIDRVGAVENLELLTVEEQEIGQLKVDILLWILEAEKRFASNKTVTSAALAAVLDELKRYCDQKRGRRAEVARSLGISHSGVRNILTQRQELTRSQTLRILAILNSPKH
jgi:hypothetical protein